MAFGIWFLNESNKTVFAKEPSFAWLFLYQKEHQIAKFEYWAIGFVDGVGCGVDKFIDRECGGLVFVAPSAIQAGYADFCLGFFWAYFCETGFCADALARLPKQPIGYVEYS